MYFLVSCTNTSRASLARGFPATAASSRSPDVSAQSRDSLEASPLGKALPHLVHAQSFFLHEIERNKGIQIAIARGV